MNRTSALSGVSSIKIFLCKLSDALIYLINIQIKNRMYFKGDYARTEASDVKHYFG